MRRYFVLLMLLIVSFGAQAQRTRYNFNSAWLLSVGDDPAAAQPGYDDSHWKAVALPHAWNEDSAYRVSIHDQPVGVAWYRKHFRLPASAAGSRVYVEFEGVRQAAEVYLNGHLLGLSENGVMAFGFDLTPWLRPGENVLAVRTDNRWDYKEKATGVTVQWNNTNFYSNFGGINKNVWLHVTPAIHQTLPLYSSLGTTGQYIWADHFDQAGHRATIHVESQVRNDGTTQASVKLYAKIADAAGKVIATMTSEPKGLVPGSTQTLGSSVEASGLRFWSWGYGNLYTVTTTLIVNGETTGDAVATRTGFRETAFHDGMIYLNGRVMQVHGYAARTTNEWPGLGIDVPPWVSDFSNGLMVEDNANLVRWMHVTPSKQDVESTDRVGLPVSMGAGDAEGDPKGRQWQARVELMRDSIVYNRNNPSILFYESGNKGIIDEHMRDMVAVRDEFDPHGGRAVGSREMLGSHTAGYGGEMLYINKSAYKPLWAHEYNRDEGARKFWNDETPPFHKDSPLYNRNQDSFALEDIARWDDYFRARPGTGRRVSSGGVNISWIDENSHFRGDNNYRRSGEVDAMRIRKDAFYAHQVMWDGWVDPEHPRVHIFGHWNYTQAKPRTVYVVANTASVELKLNGKSLGVKTPTEDFLFTFSNVPYEAGKLEAIAFDRLHHPVATNVLETAGAPARIKLSPHTAPDGLHADAADLALVDVEIVDAQGRRVPTALNMIRFRMTGPAEWRGGIAQGSAKAVPDNVAATDNKGLSATPVAPYLFNDNYILSQTLPVEGGINRVSIRSTDKPGEITLVAASDGLPEARLTLTSAAVTQHDGLSEFYPAAALPLNLARGETPSTPSYRVSRLSVPIASASAGANAATAMQSYDDDETTAWTNASASRSDVSTDGMPIRNAKPDSTSVKASLDTAWIEYTFAQPAAPSEVGLKLASFRLRRYPLRITLDGATVYEGITPTSLGYITLPLKASKPGTKLRIQMVSPPFDVEETHSLVEVNGTIDQAEVKKRQRAPILSILEMEAYTPVAR